MGVVYGILFWVVVITFFVLGVSNKKTRAGTLITAGIFLALLVILVVMFLVSLSRGLKWKESPYNVNDSTVLTMYVGEENVELFTSKYFSGYFNASTYVYVTEWYDSLDDLSDALEFEDDEQREAFVNCMTTPVEKRDSLKKLFKSQGHDDVVLYEAYVSESHYSNCYVVYCAEEEEFAFIVDVAD